MGDTGRSELLRRPLDDKAVLRHELRRLPVGDKMKVIALMQRRANEIRRATGRPVRPEWAWEVVGITPNSPPPRAGSFLASLGIHGSVQAEQRVSAELAEPQGSLVDHHPGIAVLLDVYAEIGEAVATVDSYLSSFGAIEPVQENLTSSDVTEG